MLLILFIVVFAIAVAIWWRGMRMHEKAISASEEPILADRQAFDAFQQRVQIDTQTDYGRMAKPAEERKSC